MEMRGARGDFYSASDLARVPSFSLGPLHVYPPIRTIAAGGQSATLEPRVMQVLVALGIEPGAVLSRDDLIAQAWDGRIVGDNAINRVISLLRQALAEVARDAVRLETITKVGFRLVVAPQASEPAWETGAAAAVLPPSPKFSRRAVAAAGWGALAAGGVGAAFVLRPHPHEPPPAAAKLYDQALTLIKSGRTGTVLQAKANLEMAVHIDPQFADAWGLLAQSYRHALDGFSAGERRSYPEMLRSAANRALALDPDQPDALSALAVMYPDYRRWLSLEPGLRDLQRRFPDHWYINGQLSLLLADVGRLQEALHFRQLAIRADPSIPVSAAMLGLLQLLAGRLQDSDATFDEASRRWPGQPALYFLRYMQLLETGRPVAAAAFARDPRSYPEDFPEELGQRWGRIADAVAGGSRAEKRQARDTVVALMEQPDMAARGAQILALLGETDLAFAALRADFAGGRFADFDWPAPSPLDTRLTLFLWMPSLLALRDDSRFGEVLRLAGLEDYWKRSGSQPDFRRN